MEFKKNEFRDYMLSVLALALISSIFDFGLFFTFFVIYWVSIGLKILAEKYAAQQLNLSADYNFNYNFFIISFISSVLFAGNFVFPITGFVSIGQKKLKRLGKEYSNITSRDAGWISIIGVLSHALIIFISMLLLDFNPLFFQSFININSFILLFSLIPFGKFEGSNILWWNRFIWFSVLLCSVFLSFLAIFKISFWVSLIFSIILFIIAFIFWEKTF